MKFHAVWILLLSLALAACFHDEKEKARPAALTVTPGELLVQTGRGLKLTPMILDQWGGEYGIPLEVNWVSSHPDVAAVDQEGVLSALTAGEALITVTAGGFSSQVRVTVTTDPVATEISGKVSYEDPRYNEGGSTGQLEVKPLRGVRLQLLDDRLNVLASTASGELDGSYRFEGFLPDRFWVRAISQSGEVVPRISVRAYDDALYAVRKAGSRDSRQLDLTIERALDLEGAGAFNIYSVLRAGTDFVRAAANWSPPPVTALWQRGGAGGTFYCPLQGVVGCVPGTISIDSRLTGNRDTDEFDDDVIWHEFGHFVADQVIGKDDSWGGCHSTEANDYPLPLAWSEGWGNYFSLAVKNWLKTNQPSALSTNLITTYVDDDEYPGSVRVSFNFPAAAPNRKIGEPEDKYHRAGSEVAVTNILWELDQAFGSAALFQVLMDTRYTSNRTRASSMEMFWDTWLAGRESNVDEVATLTGIFEKWGVSYTRDVYESDDSLAEVAHALVNDQAQLRALYQPPPAADPAPRRDVDLVSFQAEAGQTYEITTFNLRNGADTYMRILDANALEQASHDDVFTDGVAAYDPVCDEVRWTVDNDAMASEILFKPTVSGDYYVEVTSAAVHKGASRNGFVREIATRFGQYGGYWLKIVKK